MNTLKIAICQILAIDGDRAGNFVRIENALRQAARAHAQIACFPETALFGWVNSDAHDRAHPIPGADTDRLAALARTYDTYICIGLAEKDAHKLYDSAVLIDNHGKEMAKVVTNAAAKLNTPVIGTNLIGQITHGPWTGRL